MPRKKRFSTFRSSVLGLRFVDTPRHVNAASLQSLEIQAKICMIGSFKLLLYFMKLNLKRINSVVVSILVTSCKKRQREVLRVKFVWKLFLCHLGSIVEGRVNMSY